ncbi:MAG TPA: hypothetical protein VGF07_05490 [Stellaceae bacterium]
MRDALTPARLDWITALKAPQIRALLEAVAFQLSLLDTGPHPEDGRRRDRPAAG